MDINQTIPSELKDFTTARIIYMLNSIGHMDMALVLAKTLGDDYKSSTLLNLSETLAKLGKIDDLLEAINTVTCVSEKNKTFLKIVANLLEKGLREAATKSANAIEDERLKEDALQTLAFHKITGKVGTC